VSELALGSTKFLLQMLGYLLAVTAINLAPFALMCLSAPLLMQRLHKFGLTPISYFAVTSLCSWLSALAFNAIHFPRSAFAVLLPLGNEQSTALIGGIALSIYLALAVAPVAWLALNRLRVLARKPAFRLAVSGGLLSAVLLPLYPRAIEQAPLSPQPDIIIIGVDSVSPLHLEHHPGELPGFEALLNDATVFTNNITPLARTFPAWTSILTGQYPVHHGARFNLTDFGQVNNESTLARLLQARGYTTVYAQDERKFNNIDESFGFDITAGPQPGAAEFVLTKVSDHPMANLALLLPAGEQLFPFIALNRAAPVHYDPDEFVQAVLGKLPADRHKPLFLATHLCLAHYPYTWRNKGRAGSENGKPASIDQQHIGALASLEKQIDALMQGLKQRGRLDNTLLVVLSDHGESLGYSDGLWPVAESNPGEFNQAAPVTPFPPTSGISGHGSNVLDRSQYQSVLAFQAFGPLKAHFPARHYGGITSLVDVMPTVLTALGIAPPAKFDGVDLIAAMDKTEANHRTVSAETGISFASMASIANLNEDDLLKEAEKYYEVDPASARLIVKTDYYADLTAQKDIAVQTDDWMLAFLRSNLNTVYPRATLLVHKPTGEWTLGKDTSLIERAPVARLANHARRLYGHEITDFEASWALNQAF
jgi:arylsulfatase A-like enzyme